MVLIGRYVHSMQIVVCQMFVTYAWELSENKCVKLMKIIV